MNARTRHALCLVITTLLIAAAAAQPENVSPNALLRAAMDKETIDGDLNAAAGLYQRILEQNPAGDMGPVAEVRLAAVFEKQGRPQDALVLYERVAARLPDSTGIVEIARTRLAQSRTATAGPILKQVCSVDCGWGEAAISPSGQRIVWRNTDAVLVLQEISGARRRSLTTDSDGGVDLVWSPDDAHVAYRTRGALNASQVRVLDVRNARFRDITGGKPLTWSANGKKLLVVRPGAGAAPFDLAWMSTSGQAAKEKLMSPLRDFVVSPATGARGRGLSSPLHEGTVKVSPDGQFMAYNAGRSSGDVETYVSRVDGSGSVVASDSPDVEFPVGWTPDSRHLLIRRQSAAGALSLWAVRIVDGRPQGAPITIQRNLGTTATASLLGVSRSGTLFFKKRSDDADTYGAPLDPGSGRITSSPRPLPIPTPVDGRNVMARFSPDSRQLAYVTPRTAPGTPSGYGNGRPVLTLFSLVTGLERPLATGYGVDATAPPCWTDDGSSVTFIGSKDGASFEWLRLDVSSGAVAPAGERQGRCSDGPFPLQTGIHRRNRANATQIHRWEIANGLVIPTSFHNLTVSRSGRHVVFKERLADANIALRVVPVDGGPVVELARGADLELPNGIAWSGDDRFVFFCRRAADGTIETFRVPAGGGTAISTGYKGPGANDIDVSPDGTRLISAWGTYGEFEIWSMESFLPAAR